MSVKNGKQPKEQMIENGVIKKRKPVQWKCDLNSFLQQVADEMSAMTLPCQGINKIMVEESKKALKAMSHCLKRLWYVWATLRR